MGDMPTSDLTPNADATLVVLAACDALADTVTDVILAAADYDRQTVRDVVAAELFYAAQDMKVLFAPVSDDERERVRLAIRQQMGQA